MSGQVLPFRRRAKPAVWSDGRVQNRCDELVHLFASVPGRCQCGDRLWTLDQAGTEDPAKQPKETTSSDASP